MIEQADLVPGRQPARRLLWPAIGMAVAFLVGIMIAVYAIRRFDRVGELVRPTPPVVTAAIPAAPVAAPPVSAADPTLGRRVDRLEAQIAEIDTRADEASGDADRAEGLLVAFAARRALDRGQPMGFLEPLLRRHFGTAEPRAIAMIISAGQRPITLAQLQQRFAEIEPDLRAPVSGESWWVAFRRELGGLFVIRKADEPSNLPVDRLSRAERALTLGHVDVALDEVARLPGAANAGDWMAMARRYVLARNALDRIETAALLAPAGAPPPALPVDDAGKVAVDKASGPPGGARPE